MTTAPDGAELGGVLTAGDWVGAPASSSTSWPVSLLGRAERRCGVARPPGGGRGFSPQFNTSRTKTSRSSEKRVVSALVDETVPSRTPQDVKSLDEASAVERRSHEAEPAPAERANCHDLAPGTILSCHPVSETHDSVVATRCEHARSSSSATPLIRPSNAQITGTADASSCSMHPAHSLASSGGNCNEHASFLMAKIITRWPVNTPAVAAFSNCFTADIACDCNEAMASAVTMEPESSKHKGARSGATSHPVGKVSTRLMTRGI